MKYIQLEVSDERNEAIKKAAKAEYMSAVAFCQRAVDRALAGWIMAPEPFARKAAEPKLSATEIKQRERLRLLEFQTWDELLADPYYKSQTPGWQKTFDTAWKSTRNGHIAGLRQEIQLREQNIALYESYPAGAQPWQYTELAELQDRLATVLAGGELVQETPFEQLMDWTAIVNHPRFAELETSEQDALYLKFHDEHGNLLERV